MEKKMAWVFTRIVAMMALMAPMGCGDGKGAALHDAERAGGRGSWLSHYGIGERDVLRVRTDLERGRLWVLGLDNAYVYDLATRRLMRKIDLPTWSVSRFDCMPDLTLDKAGTAWVSSNVQSLLWRIDGRDFSVSKHPVRLLKHERWDVGFGALAFGSDGSLLALTATAGGLLWKIDPRDASGSLVDLGLPVAKRCELADVLGALASK